MEDIDRLVCPREDSGGFSVVLAEGVLRWACHLGIDQHWQELWIGHPSRRKTAYTAPQRISALLAGLACGLRGIAPGNQLLRPNSAMIAMLDGRFPDQGTIHRWLDGVTPEQAADLRRHLHQVVRSHGHFRKRLFSGDMLYVDVDGQGLIARGHKFEEAKVGWMDNELDRGFQRYVAYVGETQETLDEVLLPANRTLMSSLAEIVPGLNEVFVTRQERRHVVLRLDAHGGTVANIHMIRKAKYHYICPLLSASGIKRLKEHVATLRGSWFRYTDSTGLVRLIEFWIVPKWCLTGRGMKVRIRTHVTVFHDHTPNVQRPWLMLVSDLKTQVGRKSWERYHQRCGTIEEYNDQSERAYHLEVMRTSNMSGLNAVLSLVGLCWNLTRWSTEELTLPTVLSPNADPDKWRRAATLDMSSLMERASRSGLRLSRESVSAALEIEDTAETAESKKWCAWLRQPVQQRLRLAG